jgi:predicted neuraminidase
LPAFSNRAIWGLVALLTIPAGLFGEEKTLVDAAVLKQADGLQRANSGEGYIESYLPVLYPSSHAANLLQLRNGDLLCVWFSGTWEGKSGVGIVISRRAKGSKRWGPARLIDRREAESFQNPVLFEAPDGTVHLFHTTQKADEGEANSQVLHTISIDHGKTWSSPQVLFAKGGSFTRHPLEVLPDGAWLLPMTYVTSKGIGQGSETNYPAMEISRDNGKTWTECLLPKAEGKVQPTVVKLAANEYVAFFRDRAGNWIYRSVSADGCHWTQPEATALPNNNASVQAIRLHDGAIAIAFDNSHTDRSGARPIAGLRKPLTVALSRDGGLTWSEVRDIETGRPGYGMEEQKPKEPGREEYSYPTILQTRDGMIHVAFTYRRQTIKVVSFPESWIGQGRTVGLYPPEKEAGR